MAATRKRRSRRIREAEWQFTYHYAMWLFEFLYQRHLLQRFERWHAGRAANSGDPHYAAWGACYSFIGDVYNPSRTPAKARKMYEVAGAFQKKYAFGKRAM